MQAASITNIGQVRRQNQDRYLVDLEKGLFVVCDGMGGHKAGEVAAQIGVDTIARVFLEMDGEAPDTVLLTAIFEANKRIYRQGQDFEEYRDMGTTITAALFRDGNMYVASVGDTSLFLINQNEIKKITEDHTLAEKLIQEGLLDEKERSRHRYRHVLIRALGIQESVAIDLNTMQPQSGDYVLISSDGLTDLVEPDEIRDIVLKNSDLNEALEKMLDLALDRGGHDNITMILILVS
ncbi:MAG: Stp1/IreP family PP2C-type Ser/Thr phosphatase [Candidatus Saccharibacteria bacterium]